MLGSYEQKKEREILDRGILEEENQFFLFLPPWASQLKSALRITRPPDRSQRRFYLFYHAT